MQVTGALGKRTKHQTEDFAQLTLDVGKKLEDKKFEEAFSKDVSSQVGNYFFVKA